MTPLSSNSPFDPKLKQENYSPKSPPTEKVDNLEDLAKLKSEAQHVVQKKSIKPTDEITAKTEEQANAYKQTMLKQVQKKAPEQEKSIQSADQERFKIAIKRRDPNTLKELLKKGIDINMTFDDGTTPLTLAIACFSNETVNVLIEAGAELNKADAGGDFPLLVAIQSHNLEIVQKLLMNPKVDVNVKNRQGHTALIMGSFAGSEELVLGLLQRNVEIDKPNNEKQTALIAACAQGNDRIVDLLIKHGANPSTQDSTGASALFVSALQGHDQCVQLILKTGIKPDEATALQGYTALHAAAKNGNLQIIKHLLQAGADPHKLNDLGESPICLAAVSSQELAYEALIAKTNIEQLSQKQKQNIIAALATGDLAYSLNSLLTSSSITLPADINFATQGGQTPLMLAAAKGNKSVMNLLIKLGAEVSGVKDSFGQDPLIKAAMSCPFARELMNQMVAKGADLTHRDLNGFTAADYALLLYNDVSLYHLSPESLFNSLVHFKLIDQKGLHFEEKKESKIIEAIGKLKEALDSKRSDKLHLYIQTPIDQEVLNSVNELTIKLQEAHYDIEELGSKHTAIHSKLQVARMSGSTTMTIGLGGAEEKELAINNWKKADDMVRAWAQSGEKLTSEHLCQINKMINPKNPEGTYRNFEITAGGHISRSYVPAKEVKTEMDKFILWLDEGVQACEQKTENPIVLASLAYQWLVSVHPFSDGNGRSCRMVMDYVLQRFGLPPSSMNDVNVAVFGLIPGGISPSKVVKNVEQGLINTVNIFKEA